MGSALHGGPPKLRIFLRFSRDQVVNSSEFPEFNARTAPARRGEVAAVAVPVAT
jgi:hypothetical protein